MGSGIWQTAGSLMYNSGYTAQQFECTQFIGQKNVHSSPHRSLGLFIVQYVVFGVIVTLGKIQYTKQLFLRVVFFGKNLHLHMYKWIIEGAICYIELACVVPLSGGETVYIKVLIFISEATCEQLCVP